MEQIEDYIKETSIPGLLIIERPTYADDRGFFRETFRLEDLEKKFGRPFKIIQQNHSRSIKNTLRGIHTAPWNKLMYVTRGDVQIAITDFRKDSPTFGRVETLIVGDSNRVSIFVPAHCGNSYLVLSDEADYTYLTDQYWEPNIEYSVKYDDPDLNIKWNLEGDPILSDKDKMNPSFREVFPEKFK